MNKEPIGLYIFRFVMGFFLFAFMCMLYWSSLLIENDMKDVKASLSTLKEDLSGLKAGLRKTRGDLVNPASVIGSTGGKDKTAERPHMDSKYPNLLEPDPFYAETLPEKLLPKNFEPKGQRQEATIGKPDSLHPFSNWAQVSAWNSLCTVSVARLKFGIFETFSSDMAIKVEARPMDSYGNPEFWVHLRDDVFWAPLHPDHFSDDIKLAPFFLHKHKVTAHDFKFYFDALMNPSVTEGGAVALRNYLGDIEEIEVIDDLTFVVRWKTEKVTLASGETTEAIQYVAKQLTGELRPLARFVYQYFPDGSKIIEEDSDKNTYRTNVVWAQNFMQHWARSVIVSCGGWLFDGMTEREIRFKRNNDHYFPLDVLVDGFIVTFKNSPDGSFQAFKANQIDLYGLAPNQVVEFENFKESPLYQKQKKEGQGVNRLDYLSLAYGYIGWNQARDFFKSKMVRRAMTMAIDRLRIIEQLLNGMGVEITGPFYINSPSYDAEIEPWPYDPEMAKRLLEQEGWYDQDGDGVREKMIDGVLVPFSFRLTYYVKNPISKGICEYVATALKEIGVSCQLNGVDIADLSAVFEDKNFDALSMAWSLGTPPENPKQLWSSQGATEKGSSNMVGFSNERADEIITKLLFERDSRKRIDLYHEFHRIIHEEQPYTFLYTPKTALVYRDHLKNVFIPARRQDLVPGANVGEPISSAFWLEKSKVK